VALNQLTWNGVSATTTGTAAAPSVAPTGYYPATLPNVATANTTSTWNAQSQNNGLFGGSTGARIVTGGATTVSSTTVTGASATSFSAADVGKPIRGPGLAVGAFIATFVSCTPTTGPCTVTVTIPSTATTTGQVLSVGGNSWWQPAGASGNTGNLVVAYDLGFPKTVNSVTTSWLNNQFCPGHGTCTGFWGINYQILTSPNGTQNSWTVCKTVTGFAPTNPNTTSVDSCAAPATGAQYVEFFITSWNSTTPFSAADGYGPAFNSILIQ
jgi:hypothetical protein